MSSISFLYLTISNKNKKNLFWIYETKLKFIIRNFFIFSLDHLLGSSIIQIGFHKFSLDIYLSSDDEIVNRPNGTPRTVRCGVKHVGSGGRLPWWFAPLLLQRTEALVLQSSAPSSSQFCSAAGSPPDLQGAIALRINITPPLLRCDSTLPFNTML